MWIWLLVQLSSGAALQVPETLEAIDITLVASHAQGTAFASSAGLSVTMAVSAASDLSMEP